MKHLYIGLRTKLIIAFLLISLLPLLVTMYLALRYGKIQTQKIRAFQQQNEEIIASLNDSIQAYDESQEKILTWARRELPEEQVEPLLRILKPPDENSLQGLFLHDLQGKNQQIMEELETFVHTRQIYYTWFLLLVIGVSSAIAFVLGKFLTDPIIRLTGIANRISQGEISRHIQLHTGDEIGHLSCAFQQMMNYLQNMADTANEIANGNIQTIPRPESSQDALGTAFYKMGDYLQEITNVAHRISNGNLAETIPAKSSEDVLGLAFQRMASSLAEAIRQVQQEVQTIGTASKITAARSKEELKMVQDVLSSAEETSSSMMQMQASVEEVSGNMSTLSHSISETVSSIEQMNMSIKQIARNTTGLSHSVQETFGVVQKIGETITQLVTIANQAESASREASESASAGQTSVKEIIEGMTVIQHVVESSAETIKVLGSRSQEIDSITEVISGIADQTSLLALNASIIAAQAGEHGRGFAVVAQEVKDLAQRSLNAAKEIGELIKGIQQESQKAIQSMEEGRTAVEDGVRLANRGGDALNTILDRVRKTLEFIAENTRVTEEQAELRDQVQRYMENVLRMVNEITRAITEQQRGSSQVTEAVEKMQNLSEQVKRATIEQTRGTTHVLEAMENVTLRVQESSERTHEIVSFAADLAKETTILSELLQQFIVERQGTALVSK